MNIKHIKKALFILTACLIGITGVFTIAPLLQGSFNRFGYGWILFLINILSIISLALFMLLVALVLGNSIMMIRFRKQRKSYFWWMAFISNENRISFHLLKTSTQLFVKRWWVIANLMEENSKAMEDKMRKNLLLEHFIVALALMIQFFIYGYFIGYSFYYLSFTVLIWCAYHLNNLDEGTQNFGDYYLLRHRDVYIPFYQSMLLGEWSDLQMEGIYSFDLINNNVLWLYRNLDLVCELQIEKLKGYLERCQLQEYLNADLPFRELLNFAYAQTSLHILVCVAVLIDSDLMIEVLSNQIAIAKTRDIYGAQSQDLDCLDLCLKTKDISLINANKMGWYSSFALIGKNSVSYQALLEQVKECVK